MAGKLAFERGIKTAETRGHDAQGLDGFIKPRDELPADRLDLFPSDDPNDFGSTHAARLPTASSIA